MAETGSTQWGKHNGVRRERRKICLEISGLLISSNVKQQCKLALILCIVAI
jgi:hypothetical protein